MKVSGSVKPKAMPLIVQPQPPISAKGINAQTPRSAVRWGLILLWFMRLLGALWMLRGVLVWLGILQAGFVQPIFLAKLPLGESAMLVFFAVFDLVAAVGLWLAAPWGGVLWLVAALAQVANLSLQPSSFWNEITLSGLTIILILLYFVLSFLAARERDIVAE